MHIVNMAYLEEKHHREAAEMLNESLPCGYPTLEDAKAELRERLKPENTLLAAVEDGTVVGWGGILAPVYGGNVFELHPLVVRGDKRNRGIGRRIVRALEEVARSQGGLTIYLGADDEIGEGETSLAQVDLYQDFPEKLKNFTPGTHQAGFYLKIGYSLIGVMPDANGIGKPDLYFGKRL